MMLFSSRLNPKSSFLFINNVVFRRFISTGQARSILGLETSFNLVDLRKAYFIAAKECHPDTNQGDTDGHARFLRVTQAYEILLESLAKNHNTNEGDWTAITSEDEEQDFRRACQGHLGLSAEIVEECKTNAGFLQWLRGNTDSAHTWRNFLMAHGGLAPRLRPKEFLASGNYRGVNRRLRKR